MASKLQFVSELANQTAHNITQDVDGWKRYLSTASRLYKYPFDDQLLIYAQRPDAAACASMELWNNTMRRWVKPRSKGIALIHKDGGGRPRLEYVFDMSDTRPVKGARTPYLWSCGKITIPPSRRRWGGSTALQRKRILAGCSWSRPAAL